MNSRITATAAARSFSELMNRVRYRGESFVVERGGKPICQILPARPAKFSGAELANLLRSLPRPDEEYLAAVDDVIRKQPPWQSRDGNADRFKRADRRRAGSAEFG